MNKSKANVSDKRYRACKNLEGPPASLRLYSLTGLRYASHVDLICLHPEDLHSTNGDSVKCFVNAVANIFKTYDDSEGCASEPMKKRQRVEHVSINREGCLKVGLCDMIVINVIEGI